MTTLSAKEENLKKLVDAHQRQRSKSQSQVRYTPEPEEAETQPMTRPRRFSFQNDNSTSGHDQSPTSPRSVDQWAPANWIESKIQVAAATIQGLPRGSPLNQSKVTEVFQQERYDPITRGWRPCNLVLFLDPYTTCNDVFDPYQEAARTDSRWGVDHTVPCIDTEGWSYSFDFLTLNRLGAGEASPKWNSFVRRRKWKYAETPATYMVYDANDPEMCKVRTVRYSAPNITPFANTDRSY